MIFFSFTGLVETLEFGIGTFSITDANAPALQPSQYSREEIGRQKNFLFEDGNSKIRGELDGILGRGDEDRGERGEVFEIR